MINPIKKAIKIVGTQKKLAKRVGVGQQTISRWLKTGQVPIKQVPAVVDAVEGAIKAEELCPAYAKLLRSMSIYAKP